MQNNLIGKTFGILTVVSEAGRTKDRHIQYECVCECGSRKIISGRDLLNGHTKSCGCRQRMTHGGSYDRLYKIWHGMKSRCNNSQKYYEGIKVCDEWQDYEQFRSWAILNGYDENAPKWECTIDRIDVNGNYEPSNCRFVDESMQMFNKHKGKSKLGIRGVYYNERDRKYHAKITKGREQHYLGSYGNVDDAISARKKAELEYYGMTLEA